MSYRVFSGSPSLYLLDTGSWLSAWPMMSSDFHKGHQREKGQDLPKPPSLQLHPSFIDKENGAQREKSVKEV